MPSILLRNVEEKAEIVYVRARWGGSAGLSNVFENGSIFRSPFKTLLVNGIIFLILAPAIVCLIIGTIFDSNAAFVAMAIYAGLIILAFFILSALTSLKIICRHENAKQLILAYLVKYPKRGELIMNTITEVYDV